MRARVRSFGFLGLALLVACFLAWPAQAEAAGVKVDFRLHGGLSYLSASDVNTGCGGFFDYYQLLADSIGAATTGGYGPVHTGYDFGGDIIFRLTPNIGVGIGAGYLRSTEGSDMTVTLDPNTATIEAVPTLSAIPIRLGVFLTLPVGGKLNFTANAGAAYYASLKFDARLRIESDSSWQEMALSARRSNLSDNLGFQGGLGLEYMFSPKMGFFVEALGRLARFKNFATAHTSSVNDLGDTDESDGVIYLQANTYPEGSWTWFTVAETPPVSTPPEIVYTEPKFDFSGFCLQIGIRIRL